jgi:two-component system cell cycle response regulator
LMATCRQGDIVSRIGGEEFLVLLPHCGITDAMRKAENIRSMIELARPAGLKVTASIGIASLNKLHGDDFDKLYKAADSAVYRSKENGRNKVTADTESLETSVSKQVSTH